MLYQIVDYPNAKDLNPKLYQLINDELKDHVAGGGNRTGWFFGLEKVDTLMKWIEEILPPIAHNFSRVPESENDSGEYGSEKYHSHGRFTMNRFHGGGDLGFDPKAFSIVECWGINYGKGEGVKPHNHYPYALSFSYYVNMPEGSSPLVFEYDKVDMQEGQIIFFEGHTWHMVPGSDVSGRSVLAGNIAYYPPK